MAHDNDGKIYVDASSSPRVGVDLLADLQSVFATNHNDIGHIISDPLILINKWAKYKPVKIGGLDFPRQRNSDFTWKTVQEIEAIPETPWWKGEDGQCGLTFTTYPALGSNTISTANTFLYELLHGNLGWGYVRPTGNINRYPFRFFDFNYYLHTAPKPVTGVFDNLRLLSNGAATPTYSLTVQLDQSRAREGLGLELTDLNIQNSPVSGWYVGILLYKSDSLFTFAATSAVGDVSVEFTGLNGAYAGSATMVPFLSSVPITQGVEPNAGTFVSCDVGPQVVTINPAVIGLRLEIYAEFGQGYGYVKCTANFVNNEGTQKVIRNLHVKLYDGYQYLKNEDEGDVTISAYGQQSFTYGRTWDIVYDSSKTYKVIVSADSPTEANGEETVNDPRNPNII